MYVAEFPPPSTFPLQFKRTVAAYPDGTETVAVTESPIFIEDALKLNVTFSAFTVILGTNSTAKNNVIDNNKLTLFFILSPTEKLLIFQ